MFSGEGYKKKHGVIKTIESIKKNVADAALDGQA
jgi:uncharacterized protein YegP (UPF0339 family)